MKVFISHYSRDVMLAHRVRDRLKIHAIDSYLDAVDPLIGRNGEDIAVHLRERMAGCSHLIAVISVGTKQSQWVPWEIGMATEKDFPLASYSEDVLAVPEFLEAWPFLRRMTDLDAYARAALGGDAVRVAKSTQLNETASIRAGTKEFYVQLRRSLGQ